MNTHIDTLAEWWENAEEVESGTVAREGDHIITRKHPSPHYPDAATYVARLLGKGEEHAITAPYTRILHRAPKPKPAWHDAVAVTAETTLHYRRVWVREGDGTYSNTEGEMADDYELHDATPLIEAKVTDEMADRILDVIAARFDNYPAGIGEELAVAALGLEAE